MRIPEITVYSQFGQFIINFIKQNDWIKKVLEIGSGSGNGSTQCFIEGLRTKQNVNLTCVEPNEEWFLDLKENTKNYNFINLINKSSISYENLLIKKYDDYWNSEYSEKDSYEYRIPWFEYDINHFKKINIGEGALETNEIYDLVLIDGSEFSGYSEYLLIKDRTKCIMLDDVNVFKCKQINKELKNSKNWKLIAEGNERNGWSCFIKI